MASSGDIADLFARQDLEAVYARLAGDPEGAQSVYDGYLHLYNTGQIETGYQYVIFYSYSVRRNDQVMFDLASRIYAEHDQVLATNLFLCYIHKQGLQVYAYDVCINHCYNEAHYDMALGIFQAAIDLIGLKLIPERTQILAASCLFCLGRIDDCVEFYKRVLISFPESDDAHMNLNAIARLHRSPEAVTLSRARAQVNAASLPAYAPGPQPALDCVVTWTGTNAAEVEASINQNGFCLLRGGCDLEQVAEMARLATGIAVFPSKLLGELADDFEACCRIDARALTTNLLGRPSQIVLNSSVIRRVEPDQPDTVVPFHQDVTAFHTMLVNFWTPLTPAGGHYPSHQLVRRRIDMAEQTLIYEGNYNLIEIDAAHVLEKYGADIYTVADAQPGDCVIFLGTTIHRTYIPPTASRNRYSLEVRWR